ncbi:MAG: hypothetical protein HOV83_21500, partial [Catenulispora sp.]|nr:hypothetical protein [Catenulispora sp.]
KVDDAARQAGEFPGLNHPELDRVRAVARLLANGDRLALPADGKNRRASLHPLPDKALPDWLAEFAAHLSACGQQRLADLLRERTGAFTTAPVTLPPKASEQPANASVRLRLRLSSTRLRRKVEYRLRQRSAPAPLTGLAAVVRDLAQHEQLTSVLYAGPQHWPHRQHLVDGLADNPGRPPLATVANLSEVDRHASAYDMVVFVGGDETAAMPASVRDAGLILIEGLHSEPGYRIAAEYADDPWYLLVAHEPEAGYAVFRRAARLEETA